MKKVLFGLCIVVLLLVSPRVAFAADILYRMLHAGEVESFRQDQDALLVGQLTDQQGNRFNVRVLNVLNGRVSSDTILVDADFYYGWDEQVKPSVNDYGVFSLKKTGDSYKKALGIFKANSGDYQTLKLEALNVPTHAKGLLGDLACIQWYVNSGGTESDFYGRSGTMVVRRPNGQEIQLYSPLTTTTEDSAVDNSQHQIDNALTKDANTRQIMSSRGFLIAIAIAMAGIGSTVYAIWRKSKTK